jgi:hypothetical protein
MPVSVLTDLKCAASLLSTNLEQALEKLRELYTEDLCFENPIQRIVGREAFLRYTRNMASRWAPFSMEIDEGIESPDRLFGRFRIAFRPAFLHRTLEIEGLTRGVIRDGRIVEQRDYYDAMSSAIDAFPLASPVYRKIIAQFTIE